MRVLDLFSGVGMMAYGLEKTGFFETVAFCEIEPWPRRVLAKHWPDVTIYEDVRELSYERLREDGVISNAISQSEHVGRAQRTKATCNHDRRRNGHGSGSGSDGGAESGQSEEYKTGLSIDVITGGFPCQDLSVAGKQAGIRGERSGLFDEIIRLARELRPRYIVLENVAALLTGSNGDWARYVFGRLTEIGFDAEWHVIPAGNPDGLSAGAPHRRERVWIVAYARHDEPQGREEPAPDHEGRSGEGIQARSESASCGRESSDVAYANNQRPAQRFTGQQEDVGNSKRQRQPGQGQSINPSHQAQDGKGQANQPEYVSESRIGTTEPGMGLLADGIASRLARSRWLPEPGIGRVATGVPDRVQKLKALGNGLVWQIPYAIGKTILERHSD